MVKVELEETENRPIDIEDQGQVIDAGMGIATDVECIRGEVSHPGPKGEGAREATQKSGEAPTEIVDVDDDPVGEL